MLWNIKQVAEYLNLSKSKVYQMTSKGEIPFVKFGDSIRFKVDEIENLITKNEKNKDKDKVEILSTGSFYDPEESFNSQYKNQLIM